MSIRKHTVGGFHRHSRKVMLFGIPFLLFISGIVLVTIGGYKYISHAYYLSSLFIHDEIKVDAGTIEFPDENEPELPDPNQNSEITDSIHISEIKWPKLGEYYGKLIIESISLECSVKHGDRDQDLRKAVGHFQGSRFPGEGGNVVLVGHRNTIFKPLKDVQIGDSVIFITTYGRYEYIVSDIRITDGNDQSIG